MKRTGARSVESPAARRGSRRIAVLAGAALVLLTACGDAGGGAPRPDRPGRAADAGRAAADTDRVTADSAADTARAGTGRRPTTTLHVGGRAVRAEVADSESERRRGLMGRDSLPEDHGMLFVYPEQRTLSFWMRDTQLALDIAFIDRSGAIVDIQTMQPHTEELHRSRRPAMYALEMAAGWFEEHGVEVGDRVRF